jgi:hypothetical protein
MDPRRTIRGQQEEAPAASASAVRAPPSSIDFVYSSSSFVPLLSLLRASILSSNLELLILDSFCFQTL